LSLPPRSPRLFRAYPERGIGEHDHPLGEAGDERMEGAVVDVGGVGPPGADQAPLVEHDAERAPDDPAVVGHALAPDTREPTPALLPVGMGQLHAIAVSDAEDGRLRQEALGPALVRRAQAEQAGALGQLREQRAVVPLQPAIEGPLTAPFEHEQQRQGHHLARIQVRLRVFRHVTQGIINTTEQLRDKIDRGHGVLLLSVVSTPTASGSPHGSVN